MWKRSPKTKTPHGARVPEDLCVIAVGDVHGTLDLCKKMVDRIENVAASNPHLFHTAIFLGDYVDKGDDAKGTLGFLASLRGSDNLDYLFLKGNHEDAMLEFLERPSFGPQWIAYGGGATLSSYGVKTPGTRGSPQEWEDAAEELAAALPGSHLSFLKSLLLSYQIGDYFFVHAGIRPGIPLDRQSDGDLMWIRSQFLDDRRALPVRVVHGHSPDSQPFADDRRIGVDTGAYATGCLTAVWIMGDQIRLSSVSRTSAPVDPA